MNVHGVLRTARIASWTYRILSTAVGLITIRLIADCIGLEGYGRVAFALALLTGISGVDFGLLQALSRFVARHDHEDRSAQRPTFWACCLLMGILLFGAQSLVVLLAATLGGRIDPLAWTSPLELTGLGVTMVLANALALSSAVFAGHQMYGHAAAAKIGRSLLYVAIMLLIWWTNTLSVRSVLWANALTLLAANAISTGAMLHQLAPRMQPSWSGFPRAQMEQLREITSYSMRGWLFSLATLAVSAGSVVASGFVFTSTETAKLQIGLVLYTGVAAFVTGGMAPLTTIAARFSDSSLASRERIATTARTLIDETIILAATLTVFFTHFGKPVLAILLGSDVANTDAIQQTHAIMLATVVPGLIALPAFTFRFALVSPQDNAIYSRKVFIGTLLWLGSGLVAAAATSHLLPLAIGVGFALAYRGTLAWHMGHAVLPGITWARLLRPLALALLTCEAAALLASLLRTGWRVGEFGDMHLQAVMYLVAATSVYINRHRMPVLRLPASP